MKNNNYAYKHNCACVYNKDKDKDFLTKLCSCCLPFDSSVLMDPFY